MKRIVSILLSVCLVVSLSGCGSFLERSYVSITPHNQKPQIEADSSVIKVETYQQLLSALLYFVQTNTETGTIRLYNYTRDVNSDLEQACEEVTTEDPLGAFAVNHIQYECTHVVSYYEVSLNILYRRTAEQVKSIKNATGTASVRSEIKKALSDYTDSLVFRVSFFSEDEEFIKEQIEAYHWAKPLFAFDVPRFELATYPQTGNQRIVEIQFHYDQSADEYRKLSQAVLDKSLEVVNSIDTADTDEKITLIHNYLFNGVEYSPSAEGTIASSILDSSSSSDGIALAFKLLCDLCDVECQIVCGTLSGYPHYWNVVNTSTGYFHYDATRENGNRLSDNEQYQYGYEWDFNQIPHCGTPIEFPETESVPPVEQ